MVATRRKSWWLRTPQKNRVVVDMALSAKAPAAGAPQIDAAVLRRRSAAWEASKRGAWRRPDAFHSLRKRILASRNLLRDDEVAGIDSFVPQWAATLKALSVAAFRCGFSLCRLDCVQTLQQQSHAAAEEAAQSGAEQCFVAELRRDSEAAAHGAAAWRAEHDRRRERLRQLLRRRRDIVGSAAALLRAVRQRLRAAALGELHTPAPPRSPLGSPPGSPPLASVDAAQLRVGDTVVFLPSVRRLLQVVQHEPPPAARSPTAAGVAPPLREADLQELSAQEATVCDEWDEGGRTGPVLRLPDGSLRRVPRRCVMLRRRAAVVVRTAPPPQPPPPSVVASIIGSRVASHNAISADPPLQSGRQWPRRPLPEPKGHLYAQSGPDVDALCDIEANPFFYDAVAKGGLAIRSVGRVQSLLAPHVDRRGRVAASTMAAVVRSSYAQQVAMELRLPTAPPQQRRHVPCPPPAPAAQVSCSYNTRRERRPSLTKPVFTRHTEASARKQHSAPSGMPVHLLSTDNAATAQPLGPMYPLRPGESFTAPAERMRIS